MIPIWAQWIALALLLAICIGLSGIHRELEEIRKWLAIIGNKNN